MEKSDNKSKSWLSRLKYLKIRRQTSSISCNNEANLQRNLSTGDSENLSSMCYLHFQRRNSFRRTIVNMHNRIKNVFKHNRNINLRHPNERLIPNSNMNSQVSICEIIKKLHTLICLFLYWFIGYS